MKETASTETALDVTYTTEWVGDTVIRISPPGVNSPLYHRTRLDKVPMVEKSIQPVHFHL
jgi:hypothetical protein